MNPSNKHNRVMDLWVINEDGTIVLIRDGLFIGVSSTIYTLETSAPTTFKELTIVTDDDSYAGIEESWGYQL